MSQEHPPTEVLCTNCHGGNAPVATFCQWCGRPLRAGYTAPQVVPPQQATLQQKAQGCSPIWAGVAILVFICVVIAVIYAGLQSVRPSSSTSGISVTSTATPGPAVEGPSYQEYKGKHESMTDAQWAQYIKTLDGSHITNWEGWVLDVVRENDAVYNLKVDQDGPAETFGVEDVVIDIPVADATKYNKGQKVGYTGTIDHIACAIGYCRVIVRNAEVTLK
jgi:hypothetical protein